MALVGLWQDMVQECFAVDGFVALCLAPLLEGSIGGGKEGAGFAIVEIWDEASALQRTGEKGEARVGGDEVDDFRCGGDSGRDGDENEEDSRCQPSLREWSHCGSN